MRATPRADESIRPTQLDQVFSTRLLGAESCLQIRQGSGVIFLLHTGYHNTLGLLESTKYPSRPNCSASSWWLGETSAPNCASDGSPLPAGMSPRTWS